MSNIMQPVEDLEKQLDLAKEKAIDTLLKQRNEIDQKLRRLGHGKRGRKPAASK